MGWPDSLPLNAALDRASISDGRARFREVLDAVNKAHGAALPDYRETHDILCAMDAEGPPTGRPVPLDPIPAGVRVVAVPGFLNEVVASYADVLTDALDHLAGIGAQTAIAHLEGRGGAVRNAEHLRDFLLALPDGETVIVAAMSKGMVDTQEMLARYPETHARVQAVISLVGAVCGSPLAYLAPEWLKWVERAIPLPHCRPHGGEAVECLAPETRLAFLRDHGPVDGVRYYALCAAVDEAGMSKGMLSSFHALEREGGLNDGQMLLGDQIPPGSEVLGVLNADHIAVGIPFNRNSRLLARLVIQYGLDKNAFPREVMLEAAVRKVLEDF